MVRSGRPRCGLTGRLAIAGLTSLLIAGVGGALGDAAAQPLARYVFRNDLQASGDGQTLAWVEANGARNIWIARAPDYRPKRVTSFDQDDGQELTEIQTLPEPGRVVFVRGGDHGANWTVDGGRAPNPDSAIEPRAVELWTAGLDEAPKRLALGDHPVVSRTGQIAYIRDGAVWTVAFDGAAPRRLFFDRGKDSELAWSPTGDRLAFASARGDHSFIGVYSSASSRLTWLAADVGRDSAPVWSPDGHSIAFVRREALGGAPAPLLRRSLRPWAIWSADPTTGDGRQLWRAPSTPAGGYPNVTGHARLMWPAAHQLTFAAYLDGRFHLYALSDAGGPARLLTPGSFDIDEIENTHDSALVFSANAGSLPDDLLRRHLFRVTIADGKVTAVTQGTGGEWGAKGLPGGIAYLASSPEAPPAVGLKIFGAAARDVTRPENLPGAVSPKAVRLTAPDGVVLHGVLFPSSGDGPGVGAAIVYVHGGPSREMLLAWHPLEAYSHDYAMAQRLADQGYTVFSINYRLGVGFGHAFHEPPKTGLAGAAEYQDVRTAGLYLAHAPGIDPRRIGVWGGSYGGYLTALALARDSRLFAAGVDLVGMDDLIADNADDFAHLANRYEQADLKDARKVAWNASPIASIDRWRSPVLLIHGDDDRNVAFSQTVDLVERLKAAHVRYEALVFPDEVHGLMRQASTDTADEAIQTFFARELAAVPPFKRSKP